MFLPCYQKSDLTLPFNVANILIERRNQFLYNIIQPYQSMFKDVEPMFFRRITTSHSGEDAADRKRPENLRTNPRSICSGRRGICSKMAITAITI